ncbi:MAG: NAD(P)/FAD-dependent oxidoreductase [Chloroflexota bacterium]|nr:NAD(P)/FAD-dependent oxidoreductase [Chloroflexota bacterium]
MTPRVIVIGAGAAGLMAAGRAAELGAEVLLLEKTVEAGQKILVSGKSRCNLSNSAPRAEFLKHYGANWQFLRNAYYRFFREELLALLARYGVQTQVERGGRIFPTSGRAEDVRAALLRYATSNGARIRYQNPVQRILLDGDKVRGVAARRGKQIPAEAVILAAGGASWPKTGSTGDGYRLAQAVGHTIVPLRPALVPLVVREKGRAKALQGVSLRNIRCRFLTRDVNGHEEPLAPPYPVPPTGEMLFTHFGVSGPLILTMSLAAVDALRARKQLFLFIDLKPGMSVEEVNRRLQREFEQRPQQHLHNLLHSWIPNALAEELAKISHLGPERPVHSLRASERAVLVRLLKGFRWEITGSLPLEAGMVTAGGVELTEINPRTFASKLVKGLYIVGETLDIAADTGGFNLQAAFSGGYLAGEDSSQRSKVES